MKDKTMHMILGGFNIFAGLFALVVAIKIGMNDTVVELFSIMLLVLLATINFVSAIYNLNIWGKIK